MTALALIAAVATGIAAWGLQRWLLRVLQRRDWIGDENAYLSSSRHGFFVRVPLMRWLSDVSARRDNHPRILQAVLAVAGNAALALSVLAAGLQTGSALAAWIALPLCLLPLEYHVFARRLWPEPLLAFWHALILCNLLWLPLWPGPMIVLLGIVVLLAVMTRLEQLVLVPALILLLVGREDTAIGWTLGWLMLPTVLGLAALTLRNGLRHGVWLPDDTWRFNLQVLNSHVRTGGSLGNEAVIGQVATGWRTGAPAPASLDWRTLPVVVLQGFQRWLGMMGRDTFVEQRMLPPLGRALRNRPPAWVVGWLRYSHAGLVATLVSTVAVTGYWPGYGWIVVAMFLAVASFHARTRYRSVLVPGMVAWASTGLVGADAGDLVLIASLIPVVAWVFTRFAIPEEEPAAHARR